MNFLLNRGAARPLRAREHVVASLLMVGDAENCLLKLAYSTYRRVSRLFSMPQARMEQEDDYPYLPRKCGDSFRWDT